MTFKTLNMANLITAVRLILAFCVFALLVNNPQDIKVLYLCLFLTCIVIVGDYLDGQIARKFKISSKFGAWFDIAADRLIELGFWVVFAFLHWVSVLVPLIFLTRGIIVDGIRSFAQQEGYTAFGEKTMMTSTLGNFLVSSPFSRVTYAIVKLLAFVAVIFSHILNQFSIYSDILVILATLFCLLRGLPVLIEGFRFIKDQ
jgi:CDP-diacylglycerol--glycerol-3-phosphate 3-phosphatidyltransferase